MDKEKSFENAIEELEMTVKKLEAGALTLDESLKAFESAIGLVKICNEKLENAKRRVRILTEGEDRVITDESFTDEENEA